MTDLSAISICCRKYLVAATGVSLIGLLVIGGFNWLMNPYEVFSTPVLSGINDHRSGMPAHRRMVKAYSVTRMQPQTIILGSSRAELGLSTTHSGWKHRPVYNLGLGGASLFEIEAYFEHACEVAPIRQVLILLDFPMCDSALKPQLGFEARRLAKVGPPPIAPSTWEDWHEALFTRDAIGASIKMLKMPKSPTFELPDGSLDNEIFWKQTMQGKLDLEDAFRKFEKWSANSEGNQLGDFDLAPLRKILRVAERKKIELILAIAPVHQRYRLMSRHKISIDMLASWRRALVETVAGECKLFGAPPETVWDFEAAMITGKSPAELQQEANAGVPYYFEPAHFTKRVGDLMLDRLLHNSVTSDLNFGVPMISGECEEYIQTFKVLCEKFERQFESGVDSGMLR